MHASATLAIVLATAAALAPQVVGRWDIPYSAPDGLMLSLTADRPLFAQSIGSDDGTSGGDRPVSGLRPVFYLHCSGGTELVFLDPPERTFVLWFDEEKLIQTRFVRRVERGANRPPLEALAEPADLIAAMLTHETLYLLDRRPGGGRTEFALEGLELVLRELGDPCGWLARG